MKTAIEWRQLSKREKFKSVGSRDQELFCKMIFATAVARESEENQSLKERIEESGFDFDLGSEGGTHYIKVSYRDESTSYDEMMKVSYTTPWPLHGRELTPEFISIGSEEHRPWQRDLNRLMDDVTGLCRRIDQGKILSPDSRSDVNAFRYARFIAAATKKLGKPQDGKMFVNWQGRYCMRLYSSTEDGAHTLGLIWSGKNIPALTFSFTEPWPLCLDDFEHNILWDEKEWEEKLSEVIPLTRREYVARRPKFPHYDLEQRAKVYGLTDSP